MTKAELEEHWDRYVQHMENAETAVHAGLHRKGLESAVCALDFVDGMMRHAERNESEVFSNVPAIEMILKYSPLLLDVESLDRLGVVLKTQRRIEKKTSDDI